LAALAVPLVEGATLLLLRALGVVAVGGAGAVAVNQAAKKKAEAAEKAKSVPIAQAGSKSKTKDACTKCPPDCGTWVSRNWHMSDDSRDYQTRITGFAPFTEWSFKGADFDGFKSSSCMLLEAKAKYDQFFSSDGKPGFFANFAGLPKIMDQAQRQSLIIEASSPATLHWHFMQPLSYRYFTDRFGQLFFPIATHLTP